MGAPTSITPRACQGLQGHSPPLLCNIPSLLPESTIAVTVENSVCSKHPSFGRMSIRGMTKHRPDGPQSCAGLGAHAGQSDAARWHSVPLVPRWSSAEAPAWGTFCRPALAQSTMPIYASH